MLPDLQQVAARRRNLLLTLLTLGGCTQAHPARALPAASSAARNAAATSMAAAGAPKKPPGAVRLLLTGDVMLGRGVDQILPHHADPQIYEGWVKDARDYVALAEAANGGPLPLPAVAARGAAYPWGDFGLAEIAAMAPDATVVNLETALTARGAPWPGKGIHYRCHPANAACLAAAGVDVAALANNHALDWGRFEALDDTLAALRGAGVRAAGAGHTLAEAERPAVVELPPRSGGGGGGGGKSAGGGKDSASSGVSGAAAPAAAAAAPAGEPAGEQQQQQQQQQEHEQPLPGRVLVWAFGHESSGVMPGWDATPARPGIAVTDLSAADAERIAATVRAAKTRPGDVAVVSLHVGGNWGFDVPEAQKQFAHALLDAGGPDVVHCHSSHHAKGFEVRRAGGPAAAAKVPAAAVGPAAARPAAGAGAGLGLILWGAGDLISDYEGIANASVDAAFPKASHRDDVGALWFADIVPGGSAAGGGGGGGGGDVSSSGRLVALTVTPTRLRHLRLERPDPGDADYLERTLAREAAKLGGGAKGVRRLPVGADGTVRFAAVL